MGDARIDGRPVTLEAAIAEAAKLLGRSRLPVIAGLGTDVAGTRAAVALAERLGGVIDHMHSDALLRDLAVMQQAGAYVTTPNEARVRGDTLLLVGPGLMEAWPQIGDRLLSAPLTPQVGQERRIFWLCPGKGAALPAPAEVVGRNVGELPILLALLRAHLGGRLAKVPKAVAGLAKALQTARFGVAVWSAASLDELTVEMLFGLLDELNAETRFTGLPLMPGDNAAGVLQTCGWMTGFPPRTGFARGYPEHDPWQLDARRLIQNGEADCALWVSAFGAAEPAWRATVPTIALAGESTSFSAIYIQVGRPGLDHDSVEHDEMTGTLVAREASHRSDLPSAADVLARIAAALPGAWPC
jgi:formylmethanofuran dehydrogenase subunit B